MPRPAIAVVGPGTDVPGDVLASANEVGRLLAQGDFVVVCGGLGGVMEAAARGAREAGGLVIGLLPGRDRTGANPHLSVAIATGLGEARNALVVSSADAVIAVGGSWGTLSEIALARRAGKPVVSLHGWQVTDAGGKPVVIDEAESPKDAVARVHTALGGAST